MALQLLLLSGEVWELAVSADERAQALQGRQLKELLRDRKIQGNLTPPAWGMTLFVCKEQEEELLDGDQVPWDDLLLGSDVGIRFLRYVNAGRDLKQWFAKWLPDNAITVPAEPLSLCPPLTFSEVEIKAATFDHLLESAENTDCAFQRIVEDIGLPDEASSEFLEAWAFTIWLQINELPSEHLNIVRENGSSILTDLMEVSRGYTALAEHVEVVLIKYVTPILDPRVVNAACLHTIFYGPARPLYMCGQLRRPALRYRSGRCIGRCLAKLAISLLTLQKDKLCPESLNDVNQFGDTMLHHILVPVEPQHMSDMDASEVQWCLLLLRDHRFTEVFRRNNKGICALSYAEETDCPMVRDEIVKRMFKDGEAVAVEERRQIVQDLRGALYSAHSMLLETDCLREFIDNFEKSDGREAVELPDVTAGAQVSLPLDFPCLSKWGRLHHFLRFHTG